MTDDRERPVWKDSAPTQAMTGMPRPVCGNMQLVVSTAKDSAHTVDRLLQHDGRQGKTGIMSRPACGEHTHFQLVVSAARRPHSRQFTKHDGRQVTAGIDRPACGEHDG